MEKTRLIVIDPGTYDSAYIYYNLSKKQIIDKGIIKNEVLLMFCQAHDLDGNLAVRIEMMQSYGKPVGMEVFETLFWIGRFFQVFHPDRVDVGRVTRKKIMMYMIGEVSGSDKNIREACIQRYGHPGKKASPNPVYQDAEVKMKKDLWAAMAIVAHYEIEKEIAEISNLKNHV